MEKKEFMPYQRLWIYVALLVFINGCANSEPNPLRVTRISDQALTCYQIESEVKTLLASAGIKDEEIRKEGQQNLTAFVAGSLLLLPLLAMDVSGSETIEKRAIYLRVQRLGKLSNQKDC